MHKLSLISILATLCLSCLGEAIAASVAEEPTIMLVRNNCLKGCPEYEIRIFADGRVLYQGRNRVAVVGTRTSQISAESLQRLKEEFDRVGFFSIDISDSALDFWAPCRTKVVYECVKLSDEEKARLGIFEACQRNPIVGWTMAPRHCGMGDGVMYRDAGQSRVIRAEFLKRKDIGEKLMALHDLIDQVVGSEAWVSRGTEKQ